jgi:hypothetical protein
MNRDIYDHFKGSWVSTEDWLENRSLKGRIKDIALGIIAAISLFVCSLIILVGLLG